MKKPNSAVILAGLALVSVPTLTLPASVSATTVEIADGDVKAAVTATGVTRRGDVVVGTLVNTGADEVREIRLLIEIPFLWTNELHPGDDSPGRSSVMAVPGPIAPHGQITFEFTPTPPLPERTDGRYADPKVSVMGYESIGVRAQ